MNRTVALATGVAFALGAAACDRAQSPGAQERSAQVAPPAAAPADPGMTARTTGTAPTGSVGPGAEPANRSGNPTAPARLSSSSPLSSSSAQPIGGYGSGLNSDPNNPDGAPGSIGAGTGTNPNRGR
jgi:hypothetical protein